MSPRVLLTKVLLQKVGVLAAASVACGIVQYLFLRHVDLDTALAISRLPTALGRNICISRTCGGASIMLLFGAPAVGLASSLAYDIFNNEKLESIAKGGVLDSFDDALFRLQFAIVLVVLLANGMLSGSLLSAFVDEVRGLLSILAIQTCLLALAYASVTIATLSGYAGRK